MPSSDEATYFAYLDNLKGSILKCLRSLPDCERDDFRQECNLYIWELMPRLQAMDNPCSYAHVVVNSIRKSWFYRHAKKNYKRQGQNTGFINTHTQHDEMPLLPAKWSVHKEKDLEDVMEWISGIPGGDIVVEQVKTGLTINQIAKNRGVSHWPLISRRERAWKLIRERCEEWGMGR